MMRDATLVALRGVGQVMFQNNALSGLLMLVGLAIGSWQVALAALAGTIVSTLAGYLRYGLSEEVKQGLYGFNGTLTGIAAIVFGGVSVWSWVAIVVFPALSTLLTDICLRRHIPGYTAPFIAVTWLMLAVGHWLPNWLLPTATILPSEKPLFLFTLSLHFGQVMFEGKCILTGILFLFGILVNDRRATLYAVYGAVLPLLTVLIWNDYGLFNAGLWGYNAVLCAIAFAGSRKHDWLYATLAILLSVLLQWGGLLMGWTTLTAPFVLATWTVLILRGRIAKNAGNRL